MQRYCVPTLAEENLDSEKLTNKIKPFLIKYEIFTRWQMINMPLEHSLLPSLWHFMVWCTFSLDACFGAADQRQSFSAICWALCRPESMLSSPRMAVVRSLPATAAPTLNRFMSIFWRQCPHEAMQALIAVLFGPLHNYKGAFHQIGANKLAAMPCRGVQIGCNDACGLTLGCCCILLTPGPWSCWAKAVIGCIIIEFHMVISCHHSLCQCFYVASVGLVCLA